jgi:hypothetical protein
MMDECIALWAIFEMVEVRRITKGLPICRKRLACAGVYLHCSQNTGAKRC